MGKEYTLAFHLSHAIKQQECAILLQKTTFNDPTSKNKHVFIFSSSIKTVTFLVAL